MVMVTLGKYGGCVDVGAPCVCGMKLINVHVVDRCLDQLHNKSAILLLFVLQSTRQILSL